MAHEIGHAIMDDIYEDAYPATPNCSGHKVDTASSAGCAWTEGFADWLPLADFDPVASEAHAQSTSGGRMTGRFETMVVIDRPIEEVFAFLADGENDPKFSPRVLAIAKTTDGPPAVGTVYASTVKDAGMKTKREFKLTEFEPLTRVRWAEVSKNLVTAPEGGYDLAREGIGPASRSTTFSRGMARAS